MEAGCPHVGGVHWALVAWIYIRAHFSTVNKKVPQVQHKRTRHKVVAKET